MQSVALFCLIITNFAGLNSVFWFFAGLYNVFGRERGDDSDNSQQKGV